jgi:hypothetical protein
MTIWNNNEQNLYFLHHFGKSSHSFSFSNAFIALPKVEKIEDLLFFITKLCYEAKSVIGNREIPHQDRFYLALSIFW